MNAQNAKDYLPLIQALAEGKTIQFQDGFDSVADSLMWHDRAELDFKCLPNRYRIKPNPRRWWLAKVTDCWMQIFPEKEMAEEWVVGLMRAGTWNTKGPNPSELIELQEVTPNQTT